MKTRHRILCLLAPLAATASMFVLAANLPSVPVGSAETVTRAKRDVLVSLTITETAITASFERQQIDPATGEVIRVLSSGSTTRRIEAINNAQVKAALDTLSARAQAWYDNDRNPKQP